MPIVHLETWKVIQTGDGVVGFQNFMTKMLMRMKHNQEG